MKCVKYIDVLSLDIPWRETSSRDVTDQLMDVKFSFNALKIMFASFLAMDIWENWALFVFMGVY